MSKPRFLKPDDDGGSFNEDKSDFDPNTYTKFVYNPFLSLVLDEQRKRLPIYKNRNHILYLLEKYQSLVLVGETGCGKSTQVAQYLYEAGWCNDGRMVGITEPRRVAATTLASRVAEERGCLLGDVVGYCIRFDDCTSESTRIKYMTEGLLMREMMGDPLLRKYCVIILDEVHERTLNTDILMGLLKKIIKKQKKLKLIVASATVDADHLQRFFNFNSSTDKTQDTSAIMSVRGRTYSVDKFYLQEPIPDYVQGVVDTVIKIHSSQPPGDILAFLTGQEEVDRAVNILKEHSNSSEDGQLKLFTLPMYGSLPNSEQLKVFRRTPQGMRKAVISTNIAETSVTIFGIVYVIDCGYVKMKWFSTDSYTESLVVVPVSKAAAQQRAGRAGRMKPGKCYRLYTEDSYQSLPKETPPEMLRCELSGAVLQLKALGIDNIVRFSFPSPPPARSLLSAVELLHALGAVNDECALTEPLGVWMAEFPLSPLHAKCLVSSNEFSCSEEICSILALLQVESVWTQPTSGAGAIKSRIARRKFEVEEGDLITLLNMYTAFLAKPERDRKTWCYKHFVSYKALQRVQKIRKQMLSILNQFNIPLISGSGNLDAVRQCITAAFFPNVAYLHPSGVYKTVRGSTELHVHPSSVLYTIKQPQWVTFCETVHNQRLYMRELTVIEPSWLQDLAPHFYHKITEHY